MDTGPVGTALITGASSGIGAAFARELAARGHALLLVARRRQRLEALAAELQDRHGASAEVVVADLARPEGVARVELRIAATDGLALLVHSAGFGTVGSFAEADLGRQLEMIAVHVLAGVRLTRAALPDMLANRRGAIVTVSSPAAFIPTQGNVTYAATKAYQKVFAEALAAELRGSGVQVQILCPGFTATEFHETPDYAGLDVRARIPRALWMDAGQVARASLAALERGQLYCIPGFLNRAMIGLAQIGLAPWLGRLLTRQFPELTGSGTWRIGYGLRGADAGAQQTTCTANQLSGAAHTLSGRTRT